MSTKIKRPQLTERDLKILQWIGEQYAARLDQIQILMAQFGEVPTKQAGIVSISTVEQKIRKWQFMKLVERKKILFGQPAWLWLSKTGLRLLEIPYRYLEPSYTTLEHIAIVNQVRFYVEARQAIKGNVVTWRSERRLRYEYGRDEKQKGRHIADAELATDKGTVAIEVELGQKSHGRTLHILSELAINYPTVWYFVNDKTHEFISRQIDSLPADQKRKFQVHHLDTLKS